MSVSTNHRMYISRKPVLITMMLVVTRENWRQVLDLAAELGSAAFFLPRPLPAEIIELLAPYAEYFAMPPSTWQRISKKAKRIIKTPKILSLRGRFARVDLETVHQVLALRRAGVPIRKIADELGIPKSTVHYLVQRARKLGGDVPVIL